MKRRSMAWLALGLLSGSLPAGADTVDIREWLVPWEDSMPAAACVAPGGRVWFAGTKGDFIANFSQDSAEFNRYDLRKGTAPIALLVDRDSNLWFASHRRRLIGMLNPATGRVAEYEMPERKAKDLRSLAFDQNGDIWFTVEDGNYIGRITPGRQQIALVTVPVKNTRPFGIAVDPRNEPWVAASGRNALLHVDPATMSVVQIDTPNEDSRPRRLVITLSGQVWYADYALGRLGRYDPARQEFSEWPMPGGDTSMPFGMALDRNDRIWLVETGHIPNRLVGFDTGTESFLTETDIPSGAGSVSDLFYFEPAGEIWFGTESNYVGRAKVH